MDGAGPSEAQHNELILFALGDAPAALEAELRTRAQQDPALALQLDVLRACGRARRRTPSRLRRWLTSRTAMICCLLLLAVTMAAGLQKALTTPPLVKDTFRGTSLDSSVWEKQRDVAVVEEGRLRLVNRGAVTTVREFREPVSIRLRWMWKDLTAGKEIYADTLTVGLRTSGRHDDQRPYELLDGVRVTFRGHSTFGQISISWFDLPKHDNVHLPDLLLLPLRSDTWYDLRITDDGDTIAVFIAGPQIEAKYAREPILSSRVDIQGNGHRIGIYNREHVADVPHESYIADVVIERLK